MATISPTIDLDIPVGGVRPDKNRLAVGPEELADGANWIVRDGEFKVRPGATFFGNDTLQRPMSYAQYPHSDGNLRTVKGTVTGWWKYDVATGNFIDITQAGNALTGGLLNQVVFRVFQKAGTTTLLGVNGKDAPKKWDGVAANYVDIAGTPPVAKCMAVNGDRIILGNLSSGGTISPVAVDVSANKDFDTGWGNVLVALLGDTPGDIISMLELGNLVTAIWKTDAVYLAIFQGGTTPFRFELRAPLDKESGPASPLSVITGPSGTHLALCKDLTVKIFDGTRPRSIAKSVQAHLEQTADQDRLNRAFGIWDNEENEAWFIYPRVGSIDPDTGFILNMNTLALWPIKWTTLRPTAGAKLFIETGTTIGELAGTIGEQAGTIGDYGSRVSRVVLGDKGGKSFEDTGTTDNAVAIPAEWETGLNDLGRRRAFKTLKDILHGFDQTPASQPVNVTIGTSDDLGSRVLGTPETLDLANAPPYRTQHRVTSRRMSLKVDLSATQPVPYTGPSISVNSRGLR